MLKHKGTRRLAAGALIGVGGVLMALAPEMWVGVALLIAGGALEVAGIALERRARSHS